MTYWADREIRQANCHGTLTLGGMSMNTSAWAVLNVASLWEPAPVRRENMLIPFARGRLPVAGYLDERKDSLLILVTGTCDDDGVPYADPYVGLETNINILNSNLFSYADVVGHLSAVLTLPSGATRSGPLQFNSVQFGWEVGVAVTITADYTLPYGKLDPIAP